MVASLTRIAARPTPADWSDDDPMRLEEAAAILGQVLPITVPMLRTEIRKGRLTPAQVAGKFYVTPAQVRALFRPPECPATPKAPASTSGKGGSTGVPANNSRRDTLSETERRRSAQAAALMACEKLRGRSPPTSPKSTQRLRRQASANVTLIRS